MWNTGTESKDKRKKLYEEWFTCNCSVVEGEPGFFNDASGVGLRLRFLDDGWPDCGDNSVCALDDDGVGVDAVGDVALLDAAE